MWALIGLGSFLGLAGSVAQTAKALLTGVVGRVAFSADGRSIATAPSDGTARLFDVQTGKELGRLPTGSEVTALAYHPADSAIVLTGHRDGSSLLWPAFATTQSLIDVAKIHLARCLTRSQRQRFFLSPSPPVWCVERRLWPYHEDEWQAWLPLRRAWLAVMLTRLVNRWPASRIEELMPWAYAKAASNTVNV